MSISTHPKPPKGKRLQSNRHQKKVRKKGLPPIVLACREQLLTSIRTTTPPYSLKPNAPDRPVDWRWQRAGELYRSGHGLSRRKYDGQVAGAVDFLRAVLRCKKSTEIEQVCELSNSIAIAHNVYSSMDTRQRWGLEARILSREPFEQISKKVCVPVDAICVYEKLFFNVLDRLDSPDWITHYVIGPKIHLGLKPDDKETLFKFYAYWAGPFVLDGLVADGLDVAKPKSQGEVRAYFDQTPRSALIRRATIAIHAASLDDQRTCIRMARLAQRLTKFDKWRRQEETELSSLNTSIDFCFDRLLENLKSTHPYVEAGLLPSHELALEGENAGRDSAGTDVVLSVFGS